MSQAPATAARRHDLEQTSADVVLRALAEDDMQGAREAIPGILGEERPIHDLYGDMCASFLAFIADKLGEDAVDEAWRYVADDVWKPVLMTFKQQNDTAGLAQAFAAFLISHRYDFQVLEDDERWTFEVAWCSSGERMVAEGKVADAGGSEEGHHRFGSTRAGHPWSLGYEHFPYYDVHSALWMKLLPKEWGWDVMDVEYERKAHGGLGVARYLIYKTPRS
jgi:hypothetical protein